MMTIKYHSTPENSPVIAGRNGSPEAAVFLSGKGTLSISGVTQFKELQSENTAGKQGICQKMSKHKRLVAIFLIPNPSLESQVLLFIITAVVAENPFMQACHR